MPFAGIAFLWFIGVVRDGFGALRGQVLLVGVHRQRTAVPGDDVRGHCRRRGAVASQAFATDAAAARRVVAFGQVLLITLTKTYALRMGAVFMISLATIWLKTGLMPRWLVVMTYLVALGLLIAGDVSMWLTLAFPVWVLVVSVLLLVRAGVIDLDRDDYVDADSACSTDAGQSLDGLAGACVLLGSAPPRRAARRCRRRPDRTRASAIITQLPALMHTSRSASIFTAPSPAHRQRPQPVDEVERAELHILEVLGERQLREAAQQRGKRDAHLHPGQRCAEAVVHAVAERQVTRRAAADVESVRRRR